MRTNVVLDDQLLEEARALSGIKTKKEVVEKALQLLISHEHKKRVLSLRALMRAAADKLEIGRASCRERV